MSNTIKYSPEGGTIDVSLTTDGNELVFSVRDHGIGISQDALPRLFARGHRAPERSPQHLGLNISADLSDDTAASFKRFALDRDGLPSAVDGTPC